MSGLKLTAENVKRSMVWFFKPRLGITAIKNVSNEIKDEAAGMSAAVSSTFSKEKRASSLEWLADIESDQERFISCMNARGVKSDEIKGIEKATSLRFSMWFVLTTLSIGYSIAVLGSGSLHISGISNFFSFIWCMSFIAFLGAKAIRASFDLYQIRLQALVPFKTWLHTPSAWLGGRVTKGVVSLAALAVVGVAIGMPDAAMAQAVPTPTDALSWVTGAMQKEDLSLQWLVRLFPAGVGDSLLAKSANISPESDSFSPMFLAFNSVIMAFGSAMLAWHTLAGCVSTAHEGKVLGARWHTAWAPIRVCIGVASLAPVSGGYCGAQLLAIQILLGGYGFADGIWNTYVDNMVSAVTATTVITPSTTIPSKVISDVLAAEVCWKTIDFKKNIVINGEDQPNWIQRRFIDSTRQAVVEIPASGGVKNGSGDYQWDYGRVCGIVKFYAPATGSMPNNGSSTQNAADLANVGGLDGMPYVTAPDVKTPIDTFNDNRAIYLSNFINSVRGSGLIDNIVSLSVASPNTAPPNASSLPDQYKVVTTAASKFSDDMTKGAKTLSDALNAASYKAFKDKAKKLGWSSAGSLNPAIVQMSKVALDIVSGSMPSWSGINLSRLSPTATKEISDPLRAAQGIVEAQSSDVAAARNAPSSDPSLNSPNGSKSSTSVMASLFNTSYVSTFTSNLSDVNPMDSIMGHGQTLLVTGETAYLAIIVARSAAWGVAGAGAAIVESVLSVGASNAVGEAAKAAMETIVGVAVPLSMALIIVGVVESAILPMTPFVLWFYSVISCAAFAVAFVIAAPLAAFMHVRMDGDELIGQPQKPFYSTLFQGAMRPTLLLFGLISANKVFAVMAGFLNATIGISAIAAQNTSTSGIMINIGMEMFIAYMEYQLAVHSLELVTKVPSMVASMLGLQDIGGDEHKNATNLYGGVVSMANSQMGAGLGGAMKRPGDKPPSVATPEAEGIEKKQNSADAATSPKNRME